MGKIWTILKASGIVLEASRGRLGSVLGPSRETRKPSLGRFEDILKTCEAILKRLGASNGRKIKHSM